MKKIIDGKKYDTQTAAKVGGWSNRYGYSDSNWCEEALYLKKTGEYFLEGEGGPMSSYAEHCGNSSSSGSRIIPLSHAEAKSWSQAKMDVEDHEKLFGPCEE